MRISEFLLYKEKWFKALNERVLSLYWGILFVGVVDWVYTFAMYGGVLFSGKAPIILLYNFIGAIALVLLIGFLDVVAFSLPLFDLLKHFRKRDAQDDVFENEDEEELLIQKEVETLDYDGLLIRFMKVYILAHVVIRLVEFIFLFFQQNFSLQEVLWFNEAFQIYVSYIAPIWFAAIITKGILTVMEIKQALALMIFTTVLSWNYVLAIALTFLKDKIFSFIFL